MVSRYKDADTLALIVMHEMEVGPSEIEGDDYWYAGKWGYDTLKAPTLPEAVAALAARLAAAAEDTTSGQ